MCCHKVRDKGVFRANQVREELQVKVAHKLIVKAKLLSTSTAYTG